MLDLMEYAVKKGIAENDSQYFEMIRFPRNNISNIRAGKLSFTREQILNACKLTGASADYIFGFTNSMMRKEPTKPIDMLKQAVRAIENELKSK